jgi:hypothetical protein
MINTKALTIRLGYSRFWRTKFVPSNFYENYHHFYMEKFFEDFFCQKIFHSVGFVYGHSVVKYFPNFIRVEVFVHDFRLEEFNKNFFFITKRNFRKRNRFRKKFFRPFFRKVFSFFKRNINFKKNKRKNTYFHNYNRFQHHQKKFFDKKNPKFSTSYNSSPFSGNILQKKSFSEFVNKRNRFNKNSSFFRNRSKKGFYFSKNRVKKTRFSYCLKSIISFYRKIFKFINKFKNFKISNQYRLNCFKKQLVNIFKFFSVFKIIFDQYYKIKIFIPLINNINVFKKNLFPFFKKIYTYDRLRLLNYYSFCPYSKDFIKRNVVKILKKSDIIKRIIKDNFDKHFFMLLNVKFNSSYFNKFRENFKKFGNFKFSFKYFSTKVFKGKFKNIYKLFFSNFKFAPFNVYSFSPVFSSCPFSILSNVFFRKFKHKNVFKKSKFSKKKVNFLKKKKTYFFRFHRRIKKKKIRHFLPFFSRFRKLSYIYFKFFRFKFYRFVCNYISRNFNTKFLGIPVKFFIRVLPPFRTTSNIFLRYFITKLFYRYILGDVLNPIVRSSIRRFRGFTIVANGRFTRAQIASHRYYRRGSVSFSSISIPIDYNQICVPLKYGTCNLKLWIRY